LREQQQQQQKQRQRDRERRLLFSGLAFPPYDAFVRAFNGLFPV